MKVTPNPTENTFLAGPSFLTHLSWIQRATEELQFLPLKVGISYLWSSQKQKQKKKKNGNYSVSVSSQTSLFFLSKILKNKFKTFGLIKPTVPLPILF